MKIFDKKFFIMLGTVVAGVFIASWIMNYLSKASVPSSGEESGFVGYYDQSGYHKAA